MLQTPPRAPKANAYARRWTRTARTECLDWVLICNRRHLERVLTNYIRHDNTARPRRGNDLDVPVPSAGNADPRTQTLGHIERVDVLGGLIHDYRHAKPHLRSPACTGYRDCGAITEAALLGTRRLEPRTASCRALFRVCHWIPKPLVTDRSHSKSVIAWRKWLFTCTDAARRQSPFVTDRERWDRVLGGQTGNRRDPFAPHRTAITAQFSRIEGRAGPQRQSNHRGSCRMIDMNRYTTRTAPCRCHPARRCARWPARLTRRFMPPRHRLQRAVPSWQGSPTNVRRRGPTTFDRHDVLRSTCPSVRRGAR
ncbi:transposase [Micromonospora sp. WMMC415]|uniref:transposase n=1 Tax=Micromonospora sp. WMMC415 TaxID=2675222 RepID=UPI001E5258BC|nr:transposase [Micromonospora sp. WMMC415]